MAARPYPGQTTLPNTAPTGPMWGNIISATSKDKFFEKTEGMNWKFFDVRVTKTKEFINTYSKLSESVARDRKNGNQGSCDSSEITLIHYNRLDYPTGFLAEDITPMSDFQPNMTFFRWQSANKKLEKNISVEKMIMQQVYTTTFGQRTDQLRQ